MHRQYDRFARRCRFLVLSPNALASSPFAPSRMHKKRATSLNSSQPDVGLIRILPSRYSVKTVQMKEYGGR